MTNEINNGGVMFVYIINRVNGSMWRREEKLAAEKA